ncbi:MAG: AI-2E family transporter YdiK [Gammaproteobacteria bacterium]|nr:MAG: AI-2E family transporter YdiK [Gammaproteobacteria bacterium]
MNERDSQLTRVVLGVLFLGLLIGGSLWILWPFLGALLWAVMIVVATWPLFLRLERMLGGRRALAVTVMAVGLLLVLVIPIVLLIGALVANAGTFVGWVGGLADWRLPPPPAWLVNLPLVGASVAGIWANVGALSDMELLGRATPYVGELTRWLLSQIGNVGFIIVQFILTIIVAAIVYANGEATARFALRFARRLAGEQGERAARLAAQAIRGVALGVVGTALIQATFTGIGLAIAGVPFVPVLTAVAFLLTVAQLGVVLVLAPAVIWVFATGPTWLAVFLLVWSIVVGTADNFIRPLLIKRGADLSLVLIFAGVVGGLLTFGIIGIFVGPVVLAVSWTLLRAWTDAPESPPGAGS